MCCVEATTQLCNHSSLQESVVRHRHPSRHASIHATIFVLHASEGVVSVVQSIVRLIIQPCICPSVSERTKKGCPSIASSMLLITQSSILPALSGQEQPATFIDVLTETRRGVPQEDEGGLGTSSRATQRSVQFWRACGSTCCAVPWGSILNLPTCSALAGIAVGCMPPLKGMRILPRTHCFRRALLNNVVPVLPHPFLPRSCVPA